MVTDLTGNVVARLDNQPGAAGMALSPDGDTLYVALSRGGAVSAIDTLTLTEKARHPVGEVCPYTLAVTPDRLLFGYGCQGWQAGVGNARMTPVFGDVRLGLAGNLYSAPLMATSPGRPDLLAIGVPGLSPARVHIYHIEGGSLVPQASAEAGSNLQDLALSTDGSLLYVASGWPYELQSFTTDSLALRAGYATGPYPNSVAVSHEANVLAAGVDAAYDPDVFVYRDGSFTPSRRHDFSQLGVSPYLLARAGLAWGPRGKWLFAVTGNYSTSPTLNVLRG